MSKASLVELLEAGAHFGHRTDRWHPNAKKFIYAAKSGVHIINLEKTAQALEDAENYLENAVANGATVLMVCTKRQGKEIVRKEAERVGASFIVERWIGGTLTNFNHIHKLSQKLGKMEKDMADGVYNKYTKKERLSFQREIEKLKTVVGGLASLQKLPNIVFLIDVKKNVTALKEATKIGIPTVAVVDTNINPNEVTYPIPANDDATKTIELITKRIADAIERGNARYAAMPKPEPKVTPAASAALPKKTDAAGYVVTGATSTPAI